MDRRDILGAVGLGLVAIGVGMLSVPAAIIIVGAALLGVAVLASRPGRA